MSKESNAHRMQLPAEVLIGSGVVHQLGEVGRNVVASRRVLVITDKDVFKIAGKDSISALEEAKFDVEVLTISAATEETVEQAREAIRKQSAGLVVGCGGGSIIDTAKLSSAREKQPFISVPTIASHDGLSSPRASIKKDGASVSIDGQSPIAIVADTQVIAQAPFRYMAAGCGDLISNITAVRDWKLAHTLGYEYFGDYAASLSLMSANIIMENAKTIKPRDEQSARVVMEALIASGIAMGIAGSSRPASGAEHKFSHALDRIAPKPALHGEQCGVGSIMMAYLHGISWEDIRNALAAVGAPTTAKGLDIEPSYIIQALKEAHGINPSRYTILGDRGITEEAAKRLARITSIID
ncbi:MAG: NAD(P)-dependent glycerol-1-phosphate dehydrogenase [Promethearchaeota archaeon]